MCFRKPKLPPKTQEDIEREKELEEARLARRAQVERDLASEKERSTEAALARALGFVGNRSLITGPKGGAGYMGAGATRMRGRRRQMGAIVGPASLLPPSVSPAPTAGGGSGGGGSGGGTGSGGGGGRGIANTVAY